MSADRAALSGWGRTATTVATVAEPRDPDAVVAAVVGAPARGVVARGLGRSYGDPAQNAGGLVVRTTGLHRLLAFDPATGVVTAEAGLSLGELARLVLPHGWYVPVTPGTRHVTLGGAVAADVHGKNHHRDGSIGRYVEGLTLVTADGDVRRLSADTDPELFWGTVGGMGLTGLVLDVTLRLLRVESSWMTVDTTRAPDLDSVLATLADADTHRYSVAWLDVLATGRHAGRGVVTAGEHAPADALPPRHRRDPLAYHPSSLVTAPPWAPPGLLNRWTIAAFNEAWYRKAPARRAGQVMPLTPFFHPLDGVEGWNTAYGPHGFVQHQCVVPDDATLRALLDRLRAGRAPSLLTVLKRFGAGTPGPLSFPRAGWTLAVDVPTATPGLAALLDDLDQLVADAGGSVYLAKDARTRPQLLPAFYPRLDAWHELRERVDPSRRFVSDQSRRLSL
jgi:decaprenylphospho-beta-D-ribofuranose 2-oxidase